MAGDELHGGGAIAGKGSSAAKHETRPTVHECRPEKHDRREVVEASSPRALVGTSKHRRRHAAWWSGRRATTLGCGVAAVLR